MKAAWERLSMNPRAVLAGLVLLSHGWLLFDTGVHLDGWLVYVAQLEKNYEMLRETFFGDGLPIFYFEHRLLGAVPGVLLGYKLGALSAIMVVAQGTFAVARRFTGEAEAVFLSAAWVMSPPFAFSVDLIYWPYFLSLSLFVVGLWLALTSLERGSVGLRALSWIALSVSFSLKSLLVLHCCLLAIYAMRQRRFRALADYAALPLAFWVIHQVWFKPKGASTDYNGFIGLATQAATAARFGLYAFGTLPNSLLREALLNPWYVLMAAVALNRVLAPLAARPSRIAWGPWAILAFGTAGAYVAVGKHPIVRDWATRNALLLPLSLCPLVIAVAARWRPQVVYASVLSLLATHSVSQHWYWQARAAHNQSIIENLRGIAPPPDVSVFIVDDESWTVDVPSYRPYDYSSMFHLAWGGTSRVGIRDESELAIVPSENYHRYSMATVDTGNPARVHLTVRRTDASATEFGTAIRSYAARLRGQSLVLTRVELRSGS